MENLIDVNAKSLRRTLYINTLNHNHLIAPLTRLYLNDELRSKIIYTRSGHALATSHSRYSYRYAYYLATQAKSKLFQQCKSFINYYVQQYSGNSGKPCLYMLTVKPKFSSYKLLNYLSRLTIHELKKYTSIALIYKAIENTYTYYDNNKHTHFMIVSTSKLNKRDTVRNIKRELHNYYDGKLSIDIEKHALKDLKNVCGYVTKQQSYFPLPMKLNRELGVPQYKIMNAISYGNNGLYGSRLYKFMLEDMQSKGLQRHRLYLNSHDPYVKAYKRYANTAKGKSINLFRTVKYTEDNVRSNFSKHHYSTTENVRRFNDLNIYNGRPLKHNKKKIDYPTSDTLYSRESRVTPTSWTSSKVAVNAFVNNILNNSKYHGIVRRLMTMVNTS